MQIGICEDNQIIQEQIYNEIKKFQSEVTFLISTFINGEEMINSQIIFDLVFLDIELPGQVNGLEVAKYLQEQNNKIILVFVTFYTKYIISSFYLNTFQFILKPIRIDLFRQELLRCIEKFLKYNATFKINFEGTLLKIPIKTILAIESDKRKLLIYCTNNKIYSTYGSLRNHIQWLEKHHFLKVHSSILVNCAFITGFQDEVILTFSYNEKVYTKTYPVSRRCRKKAKLEYHEYFFKA